MKYIEVVAKYDKRQEDGRTKRVSERYLVDAVTLGNSEEIIAEYLKPLMLGDFLCTSAKVSPFVSVLNKGEESFYAVKIGYPEDKQTEQWLVGGKDFAAAHKAIEQEIAGFATDAEIISLYKSPILEIIDNN